MMTRKQSAIQGEGQLRKPTSGGQTAIQVESQLQMSMTEKRATPRAENYLLRMAIKMRTWIRMAATIFTSRVARTGLRSTWTRKCLNTS
jgi:hypothetical protein